MNDIVDRLRGVYTIPVNDGGGLLDGKDTFTQTFEGMPPIQLEAADRIERLQHDLGLLEDCDADDKAEITRLREALEKIVDEQGWKLGTVYTCTDCGTFRSHAHEPDCVFEIARNALLPPKTGDTE